MTRTTPLLLALVACAAALLTADAAAQGPATHVSGEYLVVDLGTTVCEPLDAARLRCQTTGLRSVYSGDLEGETIADFEQVLDCRLGRAQGHGTETFAGSLRDGLAGTLTWRLRFSADFDCSTFFPSNLRIVGAVTSGSGGLAGTHGVLLFDDSTYRGVLA